LNERDEVPEEDVENEEDMESPRFGDSSVTSESSGVRITL